MLWICTADSYTKAAFPDCLQDKEYWDNQLGPCSFQNLERDKGMLMLIVLLLSSGINFCDSALSGILANCRGNRYFETWSTFC